MKISNTSISIIVFIVLTFICLPNIAQAASNDTQVIVKSGIGVGTIIAIVASWTRNKSVLWAIIHAFFGWLYVIYYIITR